ncbi:MAG: chain length determinant protein EpsF [Rhodocyclaceae bacterium]
MSLRHLLLVLRSRWRTVVAVLLVCVLATAAVNLSMPMQYRAAATVVVNVKGNDPVAGNTAQQTQVVPGYLATQVGIVASDRVVKRVIAALHLTEDTALRDKWRAAGEQGELDAWIAARLLKQLQVRPAQEGNLIHIAVNWENAVRAAQIANTFAQAYIDVNLELKVEPAKQYASWFEERNQVLRKNLEQAQQRLSEYQRNKGIVATSDARLDVENLRLNELSSQLTALQGLRADSESRQKQAGADRNNLTEVLQNPVIVGLKSEHSKLEAKRADMGVRLGDQHPEMQRLNSEIAAVRDRITQETNRVAASLGVTNQVNMQRENEIRSGLNAQRQRVLELGRQRDEIAVLQNDVANAQRAYDVVTQRLAQTSLESQNQTTNVMIITPALAPLFPDSPRIKVNLVLALLCGAFLGVAFALLAERIDPRVHGAEHLRNALAVPVFGSLEMTRRVRTRGSRLGMRMHNRALAQG